MLKKTYGVLAPINEAAERRAATLNQSPFGGLLDVAAAGAAGASVGGLPGLATGVAAATGRKVIAPRIASSAAVTLDGVSKMLLESSPKIADLYQNNPVAFQNLAQSIEKRMSPQLMFAGKQDQNSASNDNSKLIQMIKDDPSKIDMIKNPALKDQIMKINGIHNPKENISPQQARSSFVDGN